MHFNDREEIIALTPQWKGERLPDGRPKVDEKYLKEDSVKYPVSFNGKVRYFKELPADMDKSQVEKDVLSDGQTAKFLDGKVIKKVIVVPGKIVNIVF